MGDVPGVEGLDDILRDLEGSKRLEARQAGQIRGGRGAIVTRGAPAEGRGPASGLGRQLLAGCGETTLRRYQTLLRFEAMLGPSDDFGYLIGPASQILEIELDRLLIEPSRAMARSLIDALLLDPDGVKQARALEAWAEGRVPATIGVGSLVLLALRRGCEHRLEPASAFLESRFASPYRDLLLSKGLGRGLDIIRVRFRNPACPGRRRSIGRTTRSSPGESSQTFASRPGTRPGRTARPSARSGESSIITSTSRDSASPAPPRAISSGPVLPSTSRWVD
jgi:hypothetical protein